MLCNVGGGKQQTINLPNCPSPSISYNFETFESLRVGFTEELYPLDFLFCCVVGSFTATPKLTDVFCMALLSSSDNVDDPTPTFSYMIFQMVFNIL